MKISAGSAKIGGPLCLYDENGDAVALISEKRADKEKIALAIVKAVNDAGGIEIQPLQQPN
jgi:hypothetical protein